MPTDTELRDHRQRAILAVLRRNRRVASQDELVELLRARGIPATQSSVSRDLQALGVARVGGRYLPPAAEAGDGEGLEGIAAFVRSAKPAGPHLTVVATTVGAAQPVASALDHAAWPEIVGTVAGDDTIFVATAGAREQKRFLRNLRGLLTR